MDKNGFITIGYIFAKIANLFSEKKCDPQIFVNCTFLRVLQRIFGIFTRLKFTL